MRNIRKWTFVLKEGGWKAKTYIFTSKKHYINLELFLIIATVKYRHNLEWQRRNPKLLKLWLPPSVYTVSICYQNNMTVDAILLHCLHFVLFPFCLGVVSQLFVQSTLQCQCSGMTDKSLVCCLNILSVL